MTPTRPNKDLRRSKQCFWFSWCIKQAPRFSSNFIKKTVFTGSEEFVKMQCMFGIQNYWFWKAWGHHHKKSCSRSRQNISTSVFVLFSKVLDNAKCKTSLCRCNWVSAVLQKSAFLCSSFMFCQRMGTNEQRKCTCPYEQVLLERTYGAKTPATYFKCLV